MGNKNKKNHCISWNIPENYTHLMSLSKGNFISNEWVLITDSKTMPLPSEYKKKIITTNNGRILIITRGTIKLNINFTPFRASKGQILIFPTGSVVELIKFSNSFEYQYFTHKEIPLKKGLHKPVLIKENYSMRERRKSYMHSLLLLTKEHPINMQAVKFLQRAFMADLTEQVSYACYTSSNMQENNGNKYFLRFIELANKYCSKEHHIAFYAGQIHISPNRLSEIIKTQSGKTALEWIHYHIVLQAKVLLPDTELNIGTISERLGFKNQAEFSRFFKRETGTTPLQYRNNL